MIIIKGFDGGTPTVRLTAAIETIAPDLLTVHDPHRAHLSIMPRYTDPGPRQATSDAWYDLRWTHPAVRNCADNGWCDLCEPGDHHLYIDHVTIGDAGHLPAPPMIPVEERIAAAPPVTLDGISDGQITMCGGPDKTLRLLAARQNAAIRDDRSVDAYDWQALAGRTVSTARSLTPPKLTPGQRAQVAAVRLLDAHRQVEAARQSVRALLANAEQAGDAETVRAMLDLIDPQPATASA